MTANEKQALILYNMHACDVEPRTISELAHCPRPDSTRFSRELFLESKFDLES